MRLFPVFEATSRILLTCGGVVLFGMIGCGEARVEAEDDVETVMEASSSVPSLPAVTQDGTRAAFDLKWSGGNGGFVAVDRSWPGCGGTCYKNVKWSNSRINAWTDTQVEYGVPYRYKVWNNAGHRGYSSAVKATKTAPASPAPAPAPAPPSPTETCQIGEASAWQSLSIEPQQGAFTLTFVASPSAAPMDGVVGLAEGVPRQYGDLAAIVRFAGDGTIDARDGAAYNDPSPAVRYKAGKRYRFRFEVDVPAARYSVYVAADGSSSESVVGTALAFRDGQRPGRLDHLGLVGHASFAGATHEVCSVETAPSPGGTSGGTGGSSTGSSSSAGPGELLRVNFDSQSPDGYSQADLKDDFVVPGVIEFHWSTNHERTDVVAGADAFAGRSLRGYFPGGTYGNGSSPINFGLKVSTPREELFFAFRVKVQSGFDFVLGGKLPGLCGGACNTGGDKPDTNNPKGFSARAMWRSGGEIVSYIYHADQPAKWGQDVPWICGGKPCKLKPGTWHLLEQRVVMNTPGKKDGVVETWFDGQHAAKRSNLRFRDKATWFGVDEMVWSNFFGGGDSQWATTKPEWIYFDDVVLSTSPISH